MHEVATIIVSYNTRDVLQRCLSALTESRGVAVGAVVVVDNGSTDGSVAMVASDFPQVRLLRNHTNRGFAAATNQALALLLNSPIPPRYILLLNSDAFLQPDALAALLAYAEAQPLVGVVAPQLRNLDGSLQPTGRPFPTLASKLADLSGWSRRAGRNNYLIAGRDYAAIAAVDEAPAACLLVRRAVFEQVGGFDEGFRFNYEDTDWCRRVADAGWQIHYLPAAQVTHLWGASQAAVRPWVELASRRGLLRYFRKHGKPWEVGTLRLMLLVLDTLAVVRNCGRMLLRPKVRAELAVTLAWRLRALVAVVASEELSV